MRKTDKTPYIFIFPFFIGFCLFNIFPIIYTFFISFTNSNGINSFDFVGASNYAKTLFRDQYFYKSLYNTVVIALMYIPASIIFAFLISLLINNKYTYFKKTFQVIAFLPYIIPSVCIAFIFAMLFDTKVGYINQIFSFFGLKRIDWLGFPLTARFVVSLMLFWKNIGFNILIISSSLSSVPQKVLEAAELDGAGSFKKLVYIVLPTLKPIIEFLLLINFVNAFCLIEEPLLLFSGWMSGISIVGGPQRSVLTTLWYLYDKAYGTTSEIGVAGAIAALQFTIIILIVVLYSKIFKRKRDTL